MPYNQLSSPPFKRDYSLKEIENNFLTLKTLKTS